MMKQTFTRITLSLALLSSAMLLASCISTSDKGSHPDESFTIAVVPDTQNMVSYKHQRAEGFAIDGSAQFLHQMAVIANWRDASGNPLAFVVGVGDVWQHQSLEMDAEHRARGFNAIVNPYFGSELAVTERVLTEEVPLAIAGYRKLHEAGIPFGVAPGNHDHDAMWSVEGFPPRVDVAPSELKMTPEYLGLLHIGGLDNFRSAFGADGEFFADKPWYVASHNGGGSSAQTFSAGGYTFLHIALEMQPSDETIHWAHSVIDRFPNMPTLISTHDYLSTDGERLVNPIVDLSLADPQQHNSSEQIWQKLISQRDEIFLVLCGHQHGQGRRVDDNVHGHQVHQVLADYQSRGQSAMDAGQPMDPYRNIPTGVGDGWFRLMEFDLSGEQALVKVRTYSSHYRAYANEWPKYAEAYRRYERPDDTDEAFIARDEFVLVLEGFRERFGWGR